MDYYLYARSLFLPRRLHTLPDMIYFVTQCSVQKVEFVAPHFVPLTESVGTCHATLAASTW